MAVKKHVENVMADYAARAHPSISVDDTSSPDQRNHFGENSEGHQRASPSSSSSVDSSSSPRFRIDERVVNGHDTSLHSKTGGKSDSDDE